MSYYYSYSIKDGFENVGIYNSNYDGSNYYSKVIVFYADTSSETFVQANFYNSLYGAYELYDSSYPNYGSTYNTYSPYYGIATAFSSDISLYQYKTNYSLDDAHYGSVYNKFSNLYSTPELSSYGTGFNYYSTASGYYEGPYYIT